MSDSYSEDSYSDGFEGDEEEYEVLPKSMTRPTSPPFKCNSRPVTPQQASRQATPPHQANRQDQRQISIPMPFLTDVELIARNSRLLAARKKMLVIKLEVVAMDDLFVLSTLSQYDLYCMARGQYAACKAATVQTNDDAKEDESQTDEVVVASYASQVPDDRQRMSDADVFAASMDVSASTRAQAPLGSATARVVNADPRLEIKLAAFMSWAGPVMLSSLGSAAGSGAVTFGAKQSSDGGLGAGVLHLAWDALLAARPVTSLALCPAAGQSQLLVAYGPVGAQLGAAQLLTDHSLGNKGCLCVWDLSAPAQPRHVLLSEGAPSCCAWAPAPAHHVVVAGMEEGGVCAWDLDEPRARHPRELVGADSVVTRRPSYTSEGQTENCGGGPIQGIVCVPKQGGGRSTPCTVVALAAFGEVQVFTMSLVAGAASAASDADLGVRIGSRVRLLRNAGSMRLGLASLGPAGVEQASRPCYCLAALPWGLTGAPITQVLVGGAGSRVLRGSWHGTPPAPKVFLSVDHNSPAATSSAAARTLLDSITCLAVSPFCQQAFLAGTSGGGLALHSSQRSTAAVIWPSVGCGRIHSVCWSPTRPAGFMALDAACVVHCFDLTQNTSGPVHTQSFMAQALSGGLASLAMQLVAAALQPEGRAHQLLPCFAVGYDDGGVDVHQISDRFASVQQPVDAELGVLREILGLQPTTVAAA